MARATHQLTAIKVTSLREPGLYPDGLGLYLRITPGGGKAWIYRFTANGKTRDMGLGQLTAVSLARARHIPVVGVYETMPEPGYHYQSWMTAEVQNLRKAVTGNVSSENL